MKRILLLRLIILLSLPSYSQTVLTKVDFLVLRMDYQSTELKSIYRFDQTIDMSSLSEQRGQYHGLDITIVPAGDFGWTKIRSTMSNQDVYHATTVWDGTGRHLYPTQDLEIKPGDSTLVLTDPEFIDIVDFYFDQEDYKRTDSVFTAVKGTKLPQTFARNTAYGAMIYLHYFSVGMNDPRTAEWIIILYSLPDHIMPYFEAQWVEITGSLSQDPLSPHIRAIAPHSFFGDSLWIGTAGGAYFSPNSGEQWNAISFDDCYQVDVPVVVTTPNPFVNCLCSVVGLGTDEPITGSSEWHGRIFRSMIDGHTWEDTQAPTFAVTALAFDPHNPDTMYAGLFNENLRQG